MAYSKGSLYKLSKSLSISSHWIWDDPGFDPFDPDPSERMLIKQIYDILAQEMERVQQDKQVRFPSHYIVGHRLQRDLGFLYSRAKSGGIAPKELLFHVILGSTPIDLSVVATGKKSKPKTLKPMHLDSVLQQHNLDSLTSQLMIDSYYINFNTDAMIKAAIRDITSLLRLYHRLRENV